MTLDGNLASLRIKEARDEKNEIEFEKMLFELKENIEDDSEESESNFNQIVSDYGFEYKFSTFVKDELWREQ